MTFQEWIQSVANKLSPSPTPTIAAPTYDQQAGWDPVKGEYTSPWMGQNPSERGAQISASFKRGRPK